LVIAEVDADFSNDELVELSLFPVDLLLCLSPKLLLGSLSESNFRFLGILMVPSKSVYPSLCSISFSSKPLAYSSLISLYLAIKTGICMICLVEGLFLGST
jgi:hypothetical protein